MTALPHADDVLLGLYRAAREQAPAQFHESLLDRVQKRFRFQSSFWCDARVADAVTLVPIDLRLRNVDPAFLADWAELHPRDPAVPIALSNPGQAFRVHVPSFYAQTPDLAELLRRYQIQSMTVLLVPAERAPGVQAICLYQRDANAFASDAEKRWLEWAMPHFCEALRVNAALHAPGERVLDADGCSVGVADAATGRLLRADAGMLALLGREWTGFDGATLPPPLARRRDRSATFTHFGRHVRIDGRRGGPLVYLTARATASPLLTPRQLEIATLYAEGFSSKQIAQRCGLAPATVRTHLAAVYESFGVHGKIEMAQRLREMLEADRRAPLRLSRPDAAE